MLTHPVHAVHPNGVTRSSHTRHDATLALVWPDHNHYLVAGKEVPLMGGQWLHVWILFAARIDVVIIHKISRRRAILT